MYIKIKTKIPHPTDEALYAKLLRVEARSMHGQLPVFWDKAKDFLVYDGHGNVFVDFTSTICVSNVGHGNSDVVNRLRSCLNRPLLHSYTFPTTIRLEFLTELVDTCYPGGKAFLVSAGTEATECACKLMRMYGYKKHPPSKRVIISWEGAMHGRTMTAEKLKGLTTDNYWAEPWDATFVKLPFPTESSKFEHDLLKYCPHKLSDIAGIMVESYQGWSAKFYPTQYIKDVASFAKRYEALLCFDEIQSGFYRTGTLFAFQHYGVKPDLICCGKGMSNGFPLSAVIGRREVLDIPSLGTMSSTHSANPLACAAGLGTLHALKDTSLINSLRMKEEVIHQMLSNMKVKFDGRGMVWAILADEKESTRIVWECFKKGLLLLWTHRDSVKIAPPLTIPMTALVEGLKVLEEVV